MTAFDPSEPAALAGRDERTICKDRYDFTTNKTGFKGVYYDPRRRGTYRAEIKLRAGGRGKRYRSKRLLTAIEAAQAYDELALEVFGPEAPINFPLNGQQQVERIERQGRSCRRGHPLSLTPDGDWACRVCNRQAVARLKRGRSR
jgi:hypothetical protein